MQSMVPIQLQLKTNLCKLVDTQARWPHVAMLTRIVIVLAICALFALTLAADGIEGVALGLAGAAATPLRRYRTVPPQQVQPSCGPQQVRMATIATGQEPAVAIHRHRVRSAGPAVTQVPEFEQT